jgi:hypothetical protein
MAVYYNQAISGHGDDIFFSGHDVQWLIYHQTTAPSGLRRLNIYDDHALRRGYIALGRQSTVLTTNRAYWYPPHWLDFADMIFSIPTLQVPGIITGESFSLVRWDLGDGAGVLYVVGV